MTPIPDFTTESMLAPIAKIIARYNLFLWVGIIAALAVGFRLSTPSDRLAVVEARATAIEQQHALIIEHQMVENRFMCVKSTVHERALIGLSCP